jgi:hypothetical protein
MGCGKVGDSTKYIPKFGCGMRTVGKTCRQYKPSSTSASKKKPQAGTEKGKGNPIFIRREIQNVKQGWQAESDPEAYPGTIAGRVVAAWKHLLRITCGKSFS